MEDKKEMLLSYIKSNVAPILVDFISGQDLKGAVVLPANIDAKELNGHYDGANYMPPKWYNELVANNNSKVLVIDLIDSINKEEQLKFIELLEYRKISTFELPKDCVIIVTAKEVIFEAIKEAGLVGLGEFQLLVQMVKQYIITQIF